MKRSLALLSILTLAALCAIISMGGAGATPRPSTYVLPGDAVFPEGVAYHPSTGDFFVSSTTDGSIVRGNVAEPAASPFIAGNGVAFSAIGLKTDDAGRLAVAGGFTGNVSVFEAATGALIRTFTSGSGGFLNDLAVAKNGDLFVTDSFRPVLWRIPAGNILSSATPGTAEPWLDLTGKIPYQPGEFNVNGIVATGNGKHLVVAQSFTSELFRIDVATRSVSEIDLGGEPVSGDGLALLGRTLYAAEPFGGGIAKVALSGELSTGTVLSRSGDPSFSTPTTIAVASGRLLVVNSQFERLFGGLPPILPFTVSSIPIP
ncbi:MAG: SMP-30/gluconolactonase/LRE family protein [Actinomycetota bacterium]